MVCGTKTTSHLSFQFRFIFYTHASVIVASLRLLLHYLDRPNYIEIWKKRHNKCVYI
jgi:hypothetical protein